MWPRLVENRKRNIRKTEGEEKEKKKEKKRNRKEREKKEKKSIEAQWRLSRLSFENSSLCFSFQFFVRLQPECVRMCSVTNGCRSIIDPTLIDDERILTNLLLIQNRYVIKSSYFHCVQPDLSVSMRECVANWMLEVCDGSQILTTLEFVSFSYSFCFYSLLFARHHLAISRFVKKNNVRKMFSLWRWIFLTVFSHLLPLRRVNFNFSPPCVYFSPLNWSNRSQLSPAN